jgi:hypothetical protein
VTVTEDGIERVALLTHGDSGGPFGVLALGWGTGSADEGAPPSITETDSQLENEHTDGGLSREQANVQNLQTTDYTADTMRWENKWIVTADRDVSEFGVFADDDTNANSGPMLLHTAFNKVLSLSPDDHFTLTVDVQVNVDSEADVSGDRPYEAVVYPGVRETNYLTVYDLYYSKNPSRFNAIALGYGNGTNNVPIATNNDALGYEFTDADPNSDGYGLSRAAATINQYSSPNSATNDTSEFRHTWTATHTATVNETGVFNSTSPPPDGDSDYLADGDTETSGKMLARHVFEDPLYLVNGDQFEMVLRAQNKNS